MKWLTTTPSNDRSESILKKGQRVYTLNVGGVGGHRTVFTKVGRQN
ncbi:MAG: hypothetical protein FWD90_06230 [Defluviitaleaceae bacterium]|nr:hypothetical protein [Defluviitaleaceae bacterium]